MRMRNKSWAKPLLDANSDFVIVNPSEYKGKWNEVLNSDTIHLEIGSGKGDYFTNMSLLYPKDGWIGVEKNINVAAIAVKKALNHALNKSKFIALDATNLDQWFEAEELNYIHLNFSDPWPKSGYRKRRLSHASFIEKYYKILKKDGKIIMKTDNKDLFEFTLLEFANTNFIMEDVSVDFRRKSHPEDVITEYENKFMSLGQPIYRVIFKK